MTTQLCDEVRGADLGDLRLNKRLVRIVDELGACPNLSIPAATDKRAEMAAAYRFFDNSKVTPEKILQPHIAATLERIAQCEMVLLVQDTTELDLTRPSQQVRGAGPMDCDARCGAFHHPLVAFTTDGIPLGTVWQKTWARDSINTSLSAAEKRHLRRETPFENKESFRWVEGLRAARDVATACPDTVCVCVSDSESDIYEFFCEPREVDAAADGQSVGSSSRLELLIRAGQIRTTWTGSDWLSDARAADVLFTNSVKVSARVAKTQADQSPRGKSREARIADVEIRAASVELRPPARADRRLPTIKVNLVLVEETNLPAGCVPIRWLLVTTLPIETLDQVQQIVALYCQRWQIEVYFRTLKSGCRVEERQFETLQRVVNSLAVYSVIAWRVMYLCRLGQQCPDLDCEVVFSPAEWQSVWTVFHRGQRPTARPSLNEMIRLIASLGGYVIRPKTRPGTQTLWIGLQHMHWVSVAWETFGPGAKKF